MTFDLIRGSGNKYFSTVRIDSRNSNCDVWWCESKHEWHWFLVWEDSSPQGTHMASGVASTKVKARADAVKTIIDTEDLWPRLEYFDHDWGGG